MSPGAGLMPIWSRAVVDKRLDTAAKICAARGAQFTSQRRAVFRLILEARTPITAYELLDLLRVSHARATPATIYRAIEFLVANDLIHKVESLSAFIPCIEVAGHGHAAQFYICQRCGAVAERDNAAVLEALKAAAAEIGFRSGNVIVEVEGLCSACAAR